MTLLPSEMSRLLRTTHRSLTSLLFAASLGALVACNDDSTKPPAPSAVVAVTPATITGLVGSQVPLTVRVNSANGSPVGGQTVTFSVVDGGGSITPLTATSDNSGNASAVWTLGTTAGTQRAQAAVAGVATNLTFTATAGAAAAATISASAGQNQTAATGAVVATAPAVLVVDRYNNPVAGVNVVWSVIGGGGSLGNPGSITNAQGIATADSWRLGPSVGLNRISALAVSAGVAGNPIVFSAQGTAGAAASIAATNSTTINAVVGSAVSPLPSVRILDASGNPVQGAQVTFTASTGSNVTPTTRLTDANGVATVDTWLLGSTVGNYTLTASSGTLTPVVFTATTRAGGAASVAINAGNNQSVGVGRPVPVEPSVRVVDAFGNPVAGVEVVFDVITGGGTIVARRPITNAQGIAEVGGWTLGTTPGQNSLRATVTGTNVTNNPILFTATATAGAPTAVTVQGGNNQTAQAGTAVATAPSVIVRDALGNPVSGVAVTFLVASGGGTVTPATVTTNANGVATVTSWTLGNATGAQTLIARVAGLPDVVFTATAGAGAPATVQLVTPTFAGNFAVNQFVAPPPAVKVLDALGNPVPGATVTFTLDAGSGSAITGTTVTTDATGTATLGAWRVGTLAGETARVRATVTGLTLAPGAEPQFTATTVAGGANGIAVAAGSVQSQGATASTAVATAPSVRVTDQFGNPVAGVTVNFTAAAGNGTVVGGSVVTNALGIATVGSWTMPAGSGTRTLTATVAGSPAITINFTAIVP